MPLPTSSAQTHALAPIVAPFISTERQHPAQYAEDVRRIQRKKEADELSLGKPTQK